MIALKRRRPIALRECKSAPPTRDAIVFETGGGARLELLRREQPTKAEHTALSFEVDDLEKEMNGDRAAWFKDTEGNILCIHERKRS